MPVVISMLRGVNVGPHNRIKMEVLRALCGPLKFREAQTYVQSGNVIFHTDQRDIVKVSKCLEDAIEKKCKFRCDVISRTTARIESDCREKSVCQKTRDRTRQTAWSRFFPPIRARKLGPKFAR